MSCELILNEAALTNIIAFHAQQAVEKAFKALMEEKGLIIPHVHNLPFGMLSFGMLPFGKLPFGKLIEHEKRNWNF